MKINKIILLYTLILMSSLAYSEDENIDPELANRINEINKYESLEGTWEGNYLVKSAPEKLFEVQKKKMEF
jgi:hypothetical protein